MYHKYNWSGKILNVFLLGILLWVIVSFLYSPVYSIFNKIFFSNGQFSFNTFAKVFGSARVSRSLINTIFMGILTIITVNIVGIFQVAVTEVFEVKFSNILKLAFFSPIIYGGVAAVSAFLWVYGPRGMTTKILLGIFPGFNISWFSGLLGVLLLHTFTMTTYHIIFVRNVARTIDQSLIEAGLAMGAKPLTIFFKIILPVMKPSIYAATLILLLGALSSNAAPTLVGKLGGHNFQMINNMIQTLSSLKRHDMAALLALMLGLVSLAVLLLFRRIESKGHYSALSSVKSSFVKIKITNKITNGIVHFFAYLLFIIIMLPVIVNILFSFTPVEVVLNDTFPNSFTLDNYIRVFSQVRYLSPLKNSLLISFIATTLSLIVALIGVVAMRKSNRLVSNLLEFSFFIPWVLPGSMLAVGLIISYAAPNILVLNNVLLGTFWLLPIAYVVFKLPFGIRMLNAALLGLNKNLEEAARSLGAGILYTYWKVVIPLLLPTILSIAALSFNGMLAEYTVANLLYGASNQPLGVSLREGAMSTDPNLATNNLVYVTVLMVISLSVILTVNHINEKRKY